MGGFDELRGFVAHRKRGLRDFRQGYPQCKRGETGLEVISFELELTIMELKLTTRRGDATAQGDERSYVCIHHLLNLFD